MDAIAVDDLDGWIDLEWGGARKRADLYELHDQIRAAQHAADGDPDKFFAAVAGRLDALGMPSLSRRGLTTAVRAVLGRVEGLRKNDPGRAPSGPPG